MIKKLIKALLIVILFPFLSFGATYYISPSGNDSTGDGSTGTPWKTFAHSFGEMSAGDTLILKDGTYSLAADTGAITFDNSSQGESGQPPSGTSTSAPTIVKAENDGLAIVDGTGEYGGYGVFIGRSNRVDSYIKIEGLKVIGGAYIYNGDYCYFKDLGVQGGLYIGAADHSDSCDYNLIEDSWCWDEDNRGIASSYEGRYNIWRRVVVRGDGCDEIGCAGSGNPNIGITVYNSQNTLMQNVIVIDRILNGGSPYGDFATAQHSGGANDYALTGNQWLGCMSVNSEDTGFHFEADSVSTPSHYIKDCVAIFDENTVAAFNVNYAVDMIVENITAYSSAQWITAVTLGSSSSGTVLRNAIIKGSASSFGVSYGGDTDYIDLSGSWGTAYNSTTCTDGCLTSDPENDGDPDSLLYLPRIESGSALDGTGYGSGDYGATIIYQFGTTGAFYGDSGYNTITATELWPWPNEDRIRTDMMADYGDSNEARGFCAPNTTLTEYIWEYLGNEIPSDIYGEDETAPVISGGSPSGAQPCTADPCSVTLSANSDEASTMRYATTDWGVEDDFTDHGTEFDTTGGTGHSQSLSLACSDSYTYYLRAIDGSGNWNGTSTEVSFSIGAEAAVSKILGNGTKMFVTSGGKLLKN